MAMWRGELVVKHYGEVGLREAERQMIKNKGDEWPTREREVYEIGRNQMLQTQ